MVYFQYKITSPIGLHARPAANITKAAEKYVSKITIGRDGDKLNGKSLMGMIALKAYEGAVLDVWIEGPDEEEARIGLLEAFDRELSRESYDKFENSP